MNVKDRIAKANSIATMVRDKISIAQDEHSRLKAQNLHIKRSLASASEGIIIIKAILEDVQDEV